MDSRRSSRGQAVARASKRRYGRSRRCAALAAAAAASAAGAAAFVASSPGQPLPERPQGRRSCVVQAAGSGRGKGGRAASTRLVCRADATGGPTGGLSLPDLGPWWAGVSSELSAFTSRFVSELAPGLAFWAAPTIALSIVAIFAGLASRRKQEADFGFVDEEGGDDFGMGLGPAKPKLTIRSWSRQVDRFAQTVTRATQGLEEASRLKKEQEEGYKKLQKQEAAAAKKAKKEEKQKEKEKGKDQKKEAEAEGEKDGKLGSSDVKPEMRRVWVLRFAAGRNDIGASGVEQLREEITAVVMAADPKRDEVVVRLDSPGGTVTGYGLAGAQLIRLKDAGLHVTVAIDQVAASGGYLMACTADKIVASNFAIIGSIGVVQELPNVYERLKREGINFETTTAGKFKRTLTPFKEPTEEDRQRVKEDLADVLRVFKDFVNANRPSVDIEQVATGETWLGPLAKERGLVDDLMTSDALLLGFAREGRQVLEVSFEAQKGSPLQQIFASAAGALAAALPGGAGGLAGLAAGAPPPMARAGAMPSAWSGLAEPREEEAWRYPR